MGPCTGNLLVQMPFHDLTEYTSHCNVTEFIDCYCVEVPKEARGYRIASTPRRAHSCYELHIHQLHSRVLLQVVPIPVIQPLSQQLNRWLGTIDLSGGHVQVIYKHNLKDRPEQNRLKQTSESMVSRCVKYTNIVTTHINTSIHTVRTYIRMYIQYGQTCGTLGTKFLPSSSQVVDRIHPFSSCPV